MIPGPFARVPWASNQDYHTGAGHYGPSEPQFDRRFIAPPHFTLVAYATLIEVGRVAPEGLDMFNKDGASVAMTGSDRRLNFGAF